MRPSIRRGEIWLAEWQRGRGNEQRGLRPSLVIQNDAGNANGHTTFLAAMSTSWRPYPFIVPIAASDSGLPRDSAVNLSQVQTMDRSRLLRQVGQLGPELMAIVDDAIRISLGLTR